MSIFILRLYTNKRSLEQPPPFLRNIHVHPGGSGQPPERPWGRPGAEQGTGLIWQPHGSVSVEERKRVNHHWPAHPAAETLRVRRPRWTPPYGQPGPRKASSGKKQRTRKGGTLQLMCRWLADSGKGNLRRKGIWAWKILTWCCIFCPHVFHQHGEIKMFYSV